MATTPIVAPIAPAARPILGIDRRSGAFLELVPSASQPGKFHLVDPVAKTCDCRGFQFRGRCRHVAPQPEPLPCSSCHNYHRTDAERLQAHPDARRDGGAAFLRALS